jgi:predicted 3-demethylubiquinone-9 3-methyltransferase (glyoxalase superfamily)
MNKITPCLWFDDNAEEALSFYTSIFSNSEILQVSRYNEEAAKASGRPAGSVLMMAFRLEGQKFTALNGGPHFKINPSISFFVTCYTETEIDKLWKQLSSGGSVLMDLQKYEWSEKYGWLQDRFGVAWQLYLGNKNEVGQTITPSLLFTGRQHGRTEEAVRFYTSVFKDSNIVEILRYEAGEIEPEGTVKHAQYSLNGNVFMAMDSSLDHPFSFNEAVSFVVDCKDQDEVDYYWNELTVGGEESQCAWLKDKFGVSWQIVPKILIEMLSDKDSSKAQRVMMAMLRMKKIIINDLKKAYNS